MTAAMLPSHPDCKEPDRRNVTTPVHETKRFIKTRRDGRRPTFGQSTQPMHTPRRPVPSHNGDGIQSTIKVQTGVWEDLKHLKIKGMRTFDMISVDD